MIASSLHIQKSMGIFPMTLFLRLRPEFTSFILSGIFKFSNLSELNNKSLNFQRKAKPWKIPPTPEVVVKWRHRANGLLVLDCRSTVSTKLLSKLEITKIELHSSMLQLWFFWLCCWKSHARVSTEAKQIRIGQWKLSCLGTGWIKRALYEGTVPTPIS